MYSLIVADGADGVIVSSSHMHVVQANMFANFADAREVVSHHHHGHHKASTERLLASAILSSGHESCSKNLGPDERYGLQAHLV